MSKISGKKSFLSQKGFSILEIVVVISILFIISSFSYASFVYLNQRENLDKEALSILSFLEEARSSTLGSKNALQYGVHFEASKAVFFSGSNYNATDPANVILTLSPIIRISSINLYGGGSDVVFERLSGETFDNGSVSVSMTVSSSSRTINVQRSGLAEIN